MIPVRPLRINQGDDYRARVNVTANGTPVDLSGWSNPRAQLRRDVADNDPTVDATFTCTIVAPNFVDMVLAKAVTVNLTGCYSYDLELTNSLGEVRTIATGPAHIRQEYTR